MRKLLLAFIVITGIIEVNAQSVYFNNRYNYVKNTGITLEALSNVIETTEGYVAVGRYSQFGTDTTGLLILKLDFNGNVINIKSFDSPDYIYYAGNPGSLTATYDGGYTLVGSRNDTLYNILLVRFNADFDTLWTRTYRFNDYFHRGDQCKQTSDSGFIILASTAVDNTSTGGQISLIKTDSAGNVEWKKEYGGAGYEYGRTVDIAPDSGFIIGAFTQSYGAGGWSDYIVKTDKDGNQQWQKTLGSIYDDCGARVITANDGGYIVYGCDGVYENNGSTYSRAYIAKLYANGNTQWRKFYGPECEGCDLWNVKELSDGSIAAVGVTDDPYVDGMLLKTTAAGDSLWYRTYRVTQGQDYLRDLQPTSDRGFVLAGFAVPYPGVDPGNQDMWIVKVDSMGCDTAGCHTVGIEELRIKNEELKVKIYPNPFSESATIEVISPSGGGKGEGYSSLERGKGCVFKLYDILGREITSLPLTISSEGTAEATLHRNALPAGMYYYQIADSNEAINAGKIIIK